MAAVLASALAWFYIKFGSSHSNRRAFANIFVLLSVTTTLVITVVKSSLALSLGLVGALSIVRFRAAIKEPEELTFLFLVIAIGLGFGAGQGTVTIVAFLVCMVCFASYRKYFSTGEHGSNFYLTISGDTESFQTLAPLASFLERNSLSVLLKRQERNSSLIEVVFLIAFENFDQYQEVQRGLTEQFPQAEWAFIDDIQLG